MIFQTTKSNEELVHLIVQKNHDAFECLYDLYASALYTTILKTIPDQHTAAAALQQTFLTIWLSIGEYDAQKERLYTWLHRKAMQTVLHFQHPVTAKATIAA